MEPKKRSWGQHYLLSAMHHVHVTSSCARILKIWHSSHSTHFSTEKKTTKLGNQAPHYNKRKLSTLYLQNLMILVLLCALQARSSARKVCNKVFAKIQAAISLGAFKLPSSCKNSIWCNVVNILSDSSDFISFLCFDFFWYRKTWTSAWFTNYLGAAHVIQ